MEIKDMLSIAALATSIASATISGYLTYINTEVQKKRKRHDFYRILKAEINSLKFHCAATGQILNFDWPADTSALKMGIYTDGKMVLLDSKETFILPEKLCYDIIQLFLYSRNTDIKIRETLEYLSANKHPLGAHIEYNSFIKKIKTRMMSCAAMCDLVLLHINECEINPKAALQPLNLRNISN